MEHDGGVGTVQPDCIPANPSVAFACEGRTQSPRRRTGCPRRLSEEGRELCLRAEFRSLVHRAHPSPIWGGTDLLGRFRNGRRVPEDRRAAVGMPGDQFYIKRLVGLGGETLALAPDYEVTGAAQFPAKLCRSDISW